MKKETTIYIKGKDAAQGKRVGAVRPTKRRSLLERRFKSINIRFFDCGQVNHQALDAEAVWVDHPILKTPSYTTEHTTWGVPNYFAGVRYLLTPFGNADYAAYTDMMFNYPITEWRQRYRRITGDIPYDGAREFEFDMRFSLRDGTITGTNERYLADLLTDKDYYDEATNQGFIDSFLTSHKTYWANSLSVAKYEGLDQLTGMLNPRNSFGDALTGGYFPFSTDDSRFKITAVNDPDATAVDPFTPTGSYDIFLMPQVGFFMGVSHSSDWATSEVLFAYQVMPRQLWPRYIEGLQLGTGGQYGSDSAVNVWLTYQRGRAGMSYSSWSYTGTGSSSSFTYSESAGDPVDDWTGQERWGAAVNGDNANPDGYHYLTRYRGSGITTDNQVNYTTEFRASSADTNFGNDLFRCDEPFLTAVIQKGSTVYYVWDVSDATDGGFGNFSAFETNGQHDRFRLSRGITWEGAYGNPPLPLDGTIGSTFNL